MDEIKSLLVVIDMHHKEAVDAVEKNEMKKVDLAMRSIRIAADKIKELAHERDRKASV